MVASRSGASAADDEPARSCLPLACLRGASAKKKALRATPAPALAPAPAPAHQNNNNNNQNGGLEGKYRVAAPELMQDAFMSDSEDEGDEVECPIQQQQQYRYMQAESSTLQRPRALDDTVTDGHRWPSNNDARPPPAHHADRGFLVSFVVDARGGVLKAARRGGVRVVVPPAAVSAPSRLTVRAAPRRPAAPHPPPLMEGEALVCRLLELQPHGAKFLAPVVLEVPVYCAPSADRELVVLRSDTGDTWQDHYLHVQDNQLVQETLARERERETDAAEDGHVARVVTSDLPHYLAVVSRVRQEVHAVGAEGGAVSSTAIPQVQAVFPPQALTKRIRVGVQAHGVPPELARRILPRAAGVSPVLTVEPRRRKFHRSITLTMPLPRTPDGELCAATPQTSGSLRLLCSIMGGQARAVWEDVTGSTPLSVTDTAASFTTTVSARFWLMDCRNVADATKLATELYKEMLTVWFEARLVVLAQRLDEREGRLLVLYLTDRASAQSLQLHNYTEVAHSTTVRLRDGRPVWLEFSGNLQPVTRSGAQPALAFHAFQDQRLELSVRLKRAEDEPAGRVYFMNEPKAERGADSPAPVCVLDVSLPDDVTPRARSQQDCLNLDQSGFDALHDELSSHWSDPPPPPATGTTPAPAPRLANGHATGLVGNGDVRRGDARQEGVRNGEREDNSRATFDSDEERTPASTLEKNANKQRTNEHPHLIDEQLLDKVEDMFKDLKTRPHEERDGTLADIAEETELRPDSTRQDRPPVDAPRQATRAVGALDAALTAGAQFASHVVADNLSTLHDDFLHAEKTHSDRLHEGKQIAPEQAINKADKLLIDAEKAVSDKFYDVRNTMTDTLQGAQQTTAQTLNDVKQVATDKMVGLRGSVKDAISDTEYKAEKTLDDVQRTTANALKDFEQSATDKIQGVKQGAADTVTDLKGAVSDAKKEVSDKLTEVIDAANEKVTDVKEKLTDVKQAATDKVTEARQSADDKVLEVQQAMADVKDAAVNKVTAAKHDVSDKIKEIKQAADNQISETKQSLTDAEQKANNRVAEVKQNVSDKVIDFKHAADNKFTEAQHAVTDLQQAAADKATDFKHTANDKMTVAQQAVTDMKQGAADQFTDLNHAAAEKVTEVKQATADKLGEAQRELQERATTISDTMFDFAATTDRAVTDAGQSVHNALNNTQHQLEDADQVEEEATRLVSSVLEEGERQARTARDTTAHAHDTLDHAAYADMDRFAHALNTLAGDVYADNGVAGGDVTSFLHAERSLHDSPAPAGSGGKTKKNSSIPKLKKKK